ncbi:MAG: WS/DGAT domain-containing protein [Candidatus Nanopelagicales bacterium]|nr:WS/DGAT domain-containing protein [Candidatus Nanopelagicales bacterium]
MATVSMSVQDALWLTMDRPNNLMVVDGSLVLRSTPTIDEVREIFAGAVERFPVLGRKAVKSGLGWAWQDDPDFDLDRHVHVVELEEGMGVDDLQRFMADQRSMPLPKDRPLWTGFLLSPLMLADGTEGSAVMTRFHHSIADGVRLTQVLLGMCESQDADVAARVARTGVQATESTSAPEEVGRVAAHAAGEMAHVVESGVEDIAHGTAEALRNPLSALIHLPGRALDVAKAGVHQVDQGLTLVRHPDRLLDALEVLGAEQHRSLNDLSSVTKIALASSDETLWSGKPGTRKALAWSQAVPIEDVKAIGKAAGATLNDVLLSAISGGLQRFLAENGESLDEVSWMVPVNLKPFEDNLPPDLGNYFALVFLPMPLDEADPRARLEQMHHRMQRIKNSDEAVLTFGLQRMVSMSPSQIAFFLTNFFANKAVGVLTNVPGPTGLLRFAGADVDQVVGFAPCSGNQPMTATIFSYNGSVTIGFATDAGLLPDPDVLVAYVMEELEAMSAAVV